MTEEGEGGDPGTRERIRRTVHRFPGIHFRGIVRELDLSTSLARYHLEILQDEGEVRSHDVGGYTRYLPPRDDADLTPEEEGILQVLRQQRPLEITLALLEFGSLQHKDLVELTDLSKSTVTYHLKKLRDAGIVHRVARGEDRGFHLEDTEHVRELLAQYDPESAVLDEVAGFWDDVFGGHRELED